MRITHLNGLRALEATLRCGTFTAAANELGVTVAAIGQQLRGLEEYLGLQLFERLPSGARPTAESRAVAARLTAGFAQIEDALADLRRTRDGHHITVTATYHFLDHWLSPRLPALYAEYPEISIGFQTSDRMVDLSAENIDMAVRFSREVTPGCVARDLFHSCYFPVCSPQFALKHALTPDTRDLTGVPLLLLHEVTKDPEWLDWPRWMNHFGLSAGSTASTSQVAGHAAAIAGSGLVLLGLSEAFNDLRDGRLVAPFGPKFIRRFSHKFRLIWLETRRPNQAMQIFIDWIEKERETYLVEASRLLGIEIT